MSLDYDLELDTSLETEATRQLLIKHLRFVPTDEDYIAKNGVVVNVRKHTRPQNVFEDDYAFAPKLSIWFWLDHHFDDVLKRNSTLAQAVAVILRHTSGNAVLLFNGDDLILKREHERIIVNGARDWLAPHLDAAQIKYFQQDAVDVLVPAA